MLEHKVSGLPVIDAAHHVVGIVSEHDLLRRRERDKGKQKSHWLQLMIEGAGLTDESARFHERSVNEVMTANPVTVAPTSSLGEACRLIDERGIKRLPVIQNGKLVGIIARADLVWAFAQTVASATASKPNNSIDDRLRELERQIWRNRVQGPKPF